MKKLSKFEIIAGIVSPILILLFLCFWTGIFALFVSGKRLNEELAYIKARREPVTLKELSPLPIPEEENVAFIYRGAFKEVGQIPKEITGLLSKRPFELTPEEKITIKEFLNAKREIFPLIAKAIACEGCRFPVKYEDGFDAKLPHLAKLRSCARLLALKALWELDKGNIEEAVNVSLQIKELGNVFSAEPILISQLVRIAIGDMMINSLKNVLLEDTLSSQSLKKFIDILDTYQKDIKRGLKLNLLGERCFFAAIFQNPEKSLIEELDMDISPGLVKFLMKSGLIKSDELYGLKIYRKLIDFTGLPSYQAIKKSKELETDVQKDVGGMWSINLFKPWRLHKIHIFSHTMLPAISKTFEVWTRHEAEIHQVRIAAALELYRIEHGVYPEDLEDISPNIFSLPKDPFTGEEFIYRKENGGFILYSVGENLKDDGGTPKAKKRTEKACTDYDIVWKCER